MAGIHRAAQPGQVDGNWSDVAEIIWHNEKRAIRELIPYEANPRQITDKQAKDLKASLAKFGIADPIIINTDNMIIGGHQRKKILETLLGYDPDFQIDVRVPDRELSIDEARELNVRLNKNVAEWDFDTLANSFELDDLLDWGFDKGELDLDLWAEDAPEDVEPQIDKAEELRVKWGVETGQLWQLGEHRLICGDCTDKAVVERLLGDDKVSMLLNDPPYGMRLDADFSSMVNDIGLFQSKKLTRGTKYLNVIGDDKDFDASLIMELFSNVKEQIWFGADYYSQTLGDTMHEGAWLVWDKRLDESADKMYGSCFELLWSKQKHKRDILRHKWAGIFGLVNEPTRGRKHPNQKPVALYEDLLTRYSDNGSVIVDCYSGSGTTIIACERLGRKCRAVEISPAYVAVAIQRWVDVTGGEPVMLTL